MIDSFYPGTRVNESAKSESIVGFYMMMGIIAALMIIGYVGQCIELKDAMGAQAAERLGSGKANTTAIVTVPDAKSPATLARAGDSKPPTQFTR
jgi:hypothetical protein